MTIQPSEVVVDVRRQRQGMVGGLVELVHHRTAIIGGILVLSLVALAVFADVISPPARSRQPTGLAIRIPFDAASTRIGWRSTQS